MLDVLRANQYASFIKRKEQLEMLGENIKTYRQKKGYTQEEVANRLHVTRQTISKWEKNYSVPDAEVLVKLADVLLLCITKMTVSTQALTLFIRWSQCLIYR